VDKLIRTLLEAVLERCF